MKRKFILLSILVSFILIIMSTNSFAEVTADLLVKQNKSKVAPGEEFEVEVYIKNLEYTNKGVDEIVLGIKNNSAIEALTVDSIVTDENQKITVGNNSLKVEDVRTAKSDEVVFTNLTDDYDSKIFIDLENPITSTEIKVIKLKFKVKEDAKDVDIDNAITITAEIGTQVTAQDLQNGFTADRTKSRDVVPLTIETVKAQNPTNNTVENKNTVTNTGSDKNTANNNTNKTNTNNTTKNQTQNNSSSSGGTGTSGQGGTSGGSTGTTSSSPSTTSAKNPTTATSSLPAAGIKYFVLPIAILGGIAVFSYKKYMKYKDIK